MFYISPPPDFHSWSELAVEGTKTAARSAVCYFWGAGGFGVFSRGLHDVARFVHIVFPNYKTFYLDTKKILACENKNSTLWVHVLLKIGIC